MGAAKCPSEDEIVTFLTGGIRGNALAALRRHLVTCGDCDAVVSEMMRDDGSNPSSVIRKLRPRVLMAGEMLADRYLVRRSLGVGEWARFMRSRTGCSARESR